MQIGTLARSGAAGLGASAITAQPPIDDWVSNAAASFVANSPDALRFARVALPENFLLVRAGENTFEKLKKHLTADSANTRRPSKAARRVSAVIATGVAVLPALALGLYVYHETGSILYAAAPALSTATATASSTGFFSRDEGAWAAMGSAAAAGLMVGRTMSSLAVAIGAGLVSAFVTTSAGIGAIALYPRLADYLDRNFSFGSHYKRILSMKELETFLKDPDTVQQFFAEHPDAYASFLRENVSSTFRQKEAEAKSRIDGLRAKWREVTRQLAEQKRAISLSNISNDDKAILVTQVRLAAKEALIKLSEAIKNENAFATAVDTFIQELIQMEEAIGQDLTARNVYEGAQKFIASMANVEGITTAAERKRLEAIFDLSNYWQRLREMSDEVSCRLQGTREVSQALLETPVA